MRKFTKDINVVMVTGKMTSIRLVDNADLMLVKVLNSWLVVKSRSNLPAKGTYASTVQQILNYATEGCRMLLVPDMEHLDKTMYDQVCELISAKYENNKRSTMDSRLHNNLQIVKAMQDPMISIRTMNQWDSMGVDIAIEAIEEAISARASIRELAKALWQMEDVIGIPYQCSSVIDTLLKYKDLANEE